MERNQVKENRKWDLKPLISDESHYERLFAEIMEGLNSLKEWEGKLTLDNALACLKKQSEISRILERVYMYTFLKLDENTALPQSQQRAERIKMLMVDYYQAISFINVELAAFSEQELQSLRQKPEFADFDRVLLSVIRNKKHILSYSEEKLLAAMHSFSVEFKNIFSMFNNADIKFSDVKDEEGSKIKMSHGNYAELMQNPSQRVRRDAFKSMYKAFEGMVNTLTAIYAGNVKKNCMQAKVRGYASAMHQALYTEVIDTKVYDNLINNVKANLPKLHEYIALRKEALGLKNYHMYDMYLPISKEAKLHLDYDEAFALVKQALAPLGEDYCRVLERAYSEGWIDVEETVNKRSGAYSWSSYDVHPYVLLNYKKTAHDVFTIAHELGHAMHSYYSNQSQCYEKAGYEIFLAEIASTVNETLLLKYLLEGAQGEDKKFLLSYYLDMFRTTVFRQTKFAEFEKFAHESVEKGEPVTKDKLNEFYFNLNKQYYGSAPVYDDYIKYEWTRIPHFYTAFYVYKYATGLISAVSIAREIFSDKSGEVGEKYRRFLSAGGSMDPLEILKIVGIDLTQNKVFENAFAEFEDALAKLREEL